MKHINYTANLIMVPMPSQKTSPGIREYYPAKFALLSYTVPMEYTIVNYIMEKLKQSKKINFEVLTEEISKIFCVEAINGMLLETLLRKRGAELKDAYLIIAS